MLGDLGRKTESLPAMLHISVLFLAIGLSLLLPTPAGAQIDAAQAPYQIRGNLAEDQSAALQAALDQAQETGGGRVLLPAGTIYAKGLALPPKVTLSGQGIGATILKLPDGANTYLLASLGFVRNHSWTDMYGGVENMTLDGNKKNNKSGSLLVLKGYRFRARNCQFRSSPLHGILISAVAADGTPNKNGMAENRVVECAFDNNAGAGIYARDGKVNRVSDGMIHNNDFNGNGELGFYQIDLERSAGFHIVGNQMYAGKIGDLRALGAGALIVRGNNFDGSSNTPVDGRVRQVMIRGGGWGSCVVSANLFHNHAKEGGDWTMLDLTSHAKDSISVTGNVFRSEQIRATPYVVHGQAKESVVFQGNAGTRKLSAQAAE